MKITYCDHFTIYANTEPFYHTSEMLHFTYTSIYKTNMNFIELLKRMEKNRCTFTYFNHQVQVQNWEIGLCGMTW